MVNKLIILYVVALQIIYVELRSCNICEKKSFKETEVKHNGRTFLINICGTVPRCGLNTSVCEITSALAVPNEIGNKNLLSCSVSDDTILYQSNKYNIKYATPGSKKVKITTTIHLKCNRRLQSDVYTYEPSTALRNHKFKLESKDFCLKKYECLFKSGDRVYDLGRLRLSEGNWKVGNADIFFNVCGRLNSLNKRLRECAYADTQACLIDKSGNDFNLGVFARYDDIDTGVSVTLSDGSACGNNTYVSTKINILCSFHDNQPTLYNRTTCNYYISWYTSAACPHQHLSGDDCALTDTFSELRNLSGLNRDRDREKLISRSLISYNFCGPLRKSCNGYRNVSVCLKENRREYVLGWENKTLMYNDGFLRMKLFGDACPRQTRRSTVNVQFACKSADTEITNTTYDAKTCTVTMLVSTRLACVYTEKNNCTAMTLNSTFDLSAIPIDNFEVADTNENLVYVLNVCQGINYDGNSLCTGFSSVCVRNNSEPNMSKRFTSLGSYTKMKWSTNLAYPNAQFESGVCQQGETDPFTTNIQFQCSNAKDRIYLSSKTACAYNFVWETNKACKSNKKARDVNCSVVNPATNYRYDFTKLITKKFSVTHNNHSYVVNVCGSIKVSCLPEGSCSETVLMSSDLLYRDKPYLIFTSDVGCGPVVNVSSLSFECALKNKLEVSSRTECYIALRLRSPYACEMANDKSTSTEILKRKQIEHTQPYYQPTQPISVPTQPNPVHAQPISERMQPPKETDQIYFGNCALHHSPLGGQLNFVNFSNSEQVTQHGRNYSVNLCRTNRYCPSPICRGSRIKYDRLKDADVDYKRRALELNFVGNACQDGFYVAKLILECHDYYLAPRIQKEGDCYVEILWQTNATCYFFGIVPQMRIQIASHAGRNAGISIGVIACLLGALGFGLYVKKRTVKCSYDTNYEMIDQHTIQLFPKQD